MSRVVGLDQLVAVFNPDLIGISFEHLTCRLSYDQRGSIHGQLMFDTGTNGRRLGIDQRYRLALHVRAH